MPEEPDTPAPSVLEQQISNMQRAQLRMRSFKSKKEEADQEPVLEETELVSTPDETEPSQWRLPIEEQMQSSAWIPPGGAKYSRGTLDKEITELFKKNGINVRVTSGKRAAGAAGKAGSKSHHVRGNAVDIVPGDGESFETIRTKMLNSPEIVQFFKNNGLGVIDETDTAVMRKTGATGKHYHIGPDTMAVNTWRDWSNGTFTGSDSRLVWTRNLHAAYKKALKEKYNKAYSDADYDRIATYMTQQAAMESLYGEKANGFNYGGHMVNGSVIHYGSLKEHVDSQLKTLSKWNFMESKSLQDFINRLYEGPYVYATGTPRDEYYQRVNGTTNRVHRYLGLSAKKYGGKFANIRQLHEQSFS